MDKETLIKIAEELHHGAFDANADYLILQQYRKNQREYAEEMKMSPAFYQTIHGALMKACFMEIAKLYDSSNGVVSIGTLLAKCAENQDLFPTYRETMTVEHDGTAFSYQIVPFPVSWTVKMKKKQKETQDILSYHTQAAGCSDKARAKASGGRQPIEECGRTGL